MFSILVVGLDHTLLATRAAVLERMTADVIVASPETALSELSQRRFDLAVLCHSLPVADAIKVAETAHAASHPVRVIQVVGFNGSKFSYDDIPADAFTEPGPEKLITKAKLLMDGFDNRVTQDS
jgi:CheY-like chemotaxis protein